MSTVLYRGKAKVVEEGPEPGSIRLVFGDTATAFNGRKRGEIRDKGRINARISALLFRVLQARGVPTHFQAELEPGILLGRRAEMVPLEVVVRNRVAGSLAQRLGLAEGRSLPRPVVELYLKDDRLGDPLVNASHAAALGWASEEELVEMERLARGVNDILRELLARVDLDLVDFKLEFGRCDGRLVVADEISPDTCRLWMRAPASGWTRTASAATWGPWRKPTGRCCGGWRPP